MDLGLACLKLYRAYVPRALRDAVGRVRSQRPVWTSLEEGWRFHDYSPARWDREYRSDRWSYMGALPELARYSVVVGYVRFLAEQGELLDLGCGEGILQARLGGASYARYVGVDISGTALELASARADERTRFVRADVSRYEPEGRFDVIVLNEVLYYLSDPIGVLRRYQRFLKPHGALVISMFVTDETRANWRVLDAHYEVADHTRTANANTGFAWDCRVLRPRACQRVALDR